MHVMREPEAISDRLRSVDHCLFCGRTIIAVPKLRCAHSGKVVSVRCFTHRSGPHHYAECIDLNLITRGDSEHEAVAKLQEAMYGYLKTAFDGDARGLVLRPSPLSHRLRYWWHRLKDRLTSHRTHFVPYVAEVPYVTESSTTLSATPR